MAIFRTYNVGSDPWPEYPRPQLRRSQWRSLNGIWTYENAAGMHELDHPPLGRILAQEVLVPSCLESGLSGIQGTNTIYSWFFTTFEVPQGWKGGRVLLNFGAVDYEATVFINGQEAAFHRGGYFAFTVDVTDYLHDGKPNDLLVFVHDPTDSDPYVIPVGKQTLQPSHIFYTSCSGIWQSVWIELAPTDHITAVDISAGMNGRVDAIISSSGSNNQQVHIEIVDRSSREVVGSHHTISDFPFSFVVDSPKLWSPDSPFLYDVFVTMQKDRVESYVGFRSLSRGIINGVNRPLLNGKFDFWFGTLDQGYWPDGIYVPPNLEAMEYDLRALKSIGINMLRKHIKIEPSLFYESCDKLGLVVIQDMPALKPKNNPNPNKEQLTEFIRQLGMMVKQLKPFTSIVAWTIYNEDWGQPDDADEFELVDMIEILDPTRLVNAVSGWQDHGAGDFDDNHHYPRPQCGTPEYSFPSGPYDQSRIALQGEFGGIGQNVSLAHLWNVSAAIATIKETYELAENMDAWNAHCHVLLQELKEQIELHACSGGVWTQTTDVEGEVNGILTYDRRLFRPDVQQWRDDIQALYDAAAKRVS
ncbi:glycoside hydrolase family 2 protein [Acidomyces richmondensis BFW]|nr:glycoside hydrolase family 2 protein [Acidomyces richmondensis BFW]